MRVCKRFQRLEHKTSKHLVLIVRLAHFFLPPDLSATSVCSQEMTFPNITTPFPSMKATRERPSQFLKVAATTHKANGGVATLDLVGDVQDLDLGSELLGLS